jgi:hypothetical protein
MLINYIMKTSDFKSESELKSMKVADIKKHVRQFNEHYAIKGYSKLKKDQLINQVLTSQMRIRKGKGTPKFKIVESKKDSPAPKKEPSKKESEEERKERLDKKFKSIGSFQRDTGGSGKILEKAGFILLPKVKGDISKLIDLVSKNKDFPELKNAVKFIIERRTFDCNSNISDLKRGIKFLDNPKRKKADLPYGVKTIKGYLEDLSQKIGKCFTMKELQKIEKNDLQPNRFGKKTDFKENAMEEMKLMKEFNKKRDALLSKGKK